MKNTKEFFLNKYLYLIEDGEMCKWDEYNWKTIKFTYILKVDRQQNCIRKDTFNSTKREQKEKNLTKMQLLIPAAFLILATFRKFLNNKK